MGLFEKISGGGTFTGAQEIKCAYLYLLTNRRLNEEEATKIGKKALLPQNGLQIGTVMMRLAFGTDEIPPANGVPTEYCTKEPTE